MSASLSPSQSPSASPSASPSVAIDVGYKVYLNPWDALDPNKDFRGQYQFDSYRNGVPYWTKTTDARYLTWSDQGSGQGYWSLSDTVDPSAAIYFYDAQSGLVDEGTPPYEGEYTMAGDPVYSLYVEQGIISPSESPSKSPSASPSASKSPSRSPSKSPSRSPSQSPSASPSASLSPSRSPSRSPSASPSQSPSVAPTLVIALVVGQKVGPFRISTHSVGPFEHVHPARYTESGYLDLCEGDRLGPWAISSDGWGPFLISISGSHIGPFKVG